uniref:Uncharacterized protein n=1 Tax=Romanomermis culicivorax TaxID=13658 RepID=A0A915IE27_ROMCU
MLNEGLFSRHRCYSCVRMGPSDVFLSAILITVAVVLVFSCCFCCLCCVCPFCCTVAFAPSVNRGDETEFRV